MPNPAAAPSVALVRAELAAGAILGLTALGLAMRFFASAGALWRDEVSTLNLALRPTWAALIATLHLDSAPALYPTLLRIWMGLGWSEPDAGVRLLGFVIAAAAVAVTWVNARALGVGVPLLALGLFAVHGIAVQTLSAVKPYGLAALLGLAAFAAIGRLVQPSTTRGVAVAVVVAVFAVQAAYQNVAIIVAAAAAAIVVCRDARVRLRVMLVAACAVISLAPYAGIVARSMEWRVVTRWDTPLAYLGRTLVSDFTGGSAGAVVWIVACALAAFVVVRERASDRTLVYVLLAGALGVLAAAAVIIVARRPPHVWHWILPLGITATALDVALARAVWLRWTRIGLALVAAGWLLPAALDRTGARQTNVDDVARYVARASAPDDLVVVNAWYVGISFSRYYEGRARWMTIPPLDDVSVHRFDLVKQRMMAVDPLQALHAEIQRTLRGGHRVWLVGGLHFPGEGAQPGTLVPAPGLPSGWNEEVYTKGWSMQTGFLVQNSIVRGHLLNVPSDRPVQRLENVPLIVVEGWRASQPR